MSLGLGGIAFEVGPRARLTADEQRVLAGLAAGPGASGPPFRIDLLDAPPWPGSQARSAMVECRDGAVSITHRAFAAWLDPSRSAGLLWRRPALPVALKLTLRTAMMARLPLEGGIALHAAGLATEGDGVAFFGPSGAGKSTLAARSPHPVLSDELVAVVAGPSFGLAATGVWGTLGERPLPRQAPPLRALVELARGPAFRLERLGPSEALKRLLGVTMVPLSPPLWTAALEVVRRLVSAVPVYRMEWSPTAPPPWEELAGALAVRASAP